MTEYRQWRTGAVFHANIIVAEALAKNGVSQAIDLQLDNNNENRAGYARIATFLLSGMAQSTKKGVATRAVLVNYASDNGNSDYTAQLAIGGQQTGLPSKTPASAPSQVPQADSVSVKYDITWCVVLACPLYFERLVGLTTPPTAVSGLCKIPVPAPSVALVFLSDEALTNSGGAARDASGSTLPFATTYTSGKVHTTIDLAALATSNGRNGSLPLGATYVQGRSGERLGLGWLEVLRTFGGALR
ncbi:hypothetical protein FRC04_004623 [Tulasnella sp. 424]|nr:hypothetical protein FRC04_004623 [Tulasnella sp. 424]